MNCTCGISTGSPRVPASVCTTGTSRCHVLHVESGLDILDKTRRASTKRAATNMGDAGLPEEVLQICFCANEVVDDLVDARPAPSRPSALAVAQVEFPGAPAVFVRFERGGPCGHQWTTLWPSVDDPVAIRGRPCGHPWTTLWPSVDDPVVIRGRPCGHPWTTLVIGGRPSPISTSSTISACATWWSSAVLNSHRSGRQGSQRFSNDLQSRLSSPRPVLVELARLAPRVTLTTLSM